MYYRRNESFGKIYKVLLCESEQWKNVTALAIATGRSLYVSEWQPTYSNYDEHNYRWQQMLTGQYIEMSVNGASTIFGLVSTVIEQSFGHCHAYRTYWQHLLVKDKPTWSSPHSENERQRSVNDFYLSNMGNICSNRLQTFSYEILAAVSGKNNSNMPPAASWKWARMEHQQCYILHIW